MSGVRIYLEGGGKSKEGKAPLRTGMDAFLSILKMRVQAKRWDWKLIPCGGRTETYQAFENANKQYPDELIFLLVDSEEGVSKEPIQHLKERDSWPLGSVADDRVHLMARTMEAWIVSDVEALQKFYGKEFAANALPKAQNLENVAKLDLANALAQATRKTTKGEYQKIKHASLLLERIDPQLARQRCPHCERMFLKVEALITQ